MNTRTADPKLLFNVIDGGLNAAAQASDHAMLHQPLPPMSGPELAADMAEIYAMALLRDVPFDQMNNPHHAIRVDASTHFTLHELLCELRSLTWFDRRALPSSGDEVTAFSRAGQGDDGHRRSLRWNGDGQLTLRTLFRGGVACDGVTAPISPVWRQGIRAAGENVLDDAPQETASMSAWIDWLDRTVGADLPLPGRDRAARKTVKTPRDLAVQVHTGHPGQVFFAVALRLLGLGVGYDAGLQSSAALQQRWTGQRLLSLMSAALRRATALAQVRGGRAERLSRPGVTAARFAVMHTRDDLKTGPDGALLREAIDELSAAAPNLLHWVSRMNAAANPRARFRENLLLPVMVGAGAPLHPSDGASQALAAGALVTLMKAIFDLPGRQPHLAPAAAIGMDTAALDRLAGDVALGRTVAGGYYHAENHWDLRMGEALGLQIMREALEADNLTAAISLKGFDGQVHDIAANPRAFGRGCATLRTGGTFAPWVADDRRMGGHLTAVV